MADVVNKRIVLAAHPVGAPKDSDFRLEEVPVGDPGDGEVLIRQVYFSLDPYMRGRMNKGASYAAGVPIGGVMEAGGVGEVMFKNKTLYDQTKGNFPRCLVNRLPRMHMDTRGFGGALVARRL